MPATTPTYDGAPIFGSAVTILHQKAPTAAQVTSFFGVNGVQTLYAGSRGRAFFVRGCLLGTSVAFLNEAEQNFENVADGIARTLVDTRGRSWDNVIFRGEFHPDDSGYRVGTGGLLVLPYRAVFHGLI
jgi:hypothetical protein